MKSKSFIFRISNITSAQLEFLVSELSLTRSEIIRELINEKYRYLVDRKVSHNEPHIFKF